MKVPAVISRSDWPPLWREARVGLEAAALLRDPILRGQGMSDGLGRPVVLVPGFLAGDASLAPMAAWLRRAGYRPTRAGMRAIPASTSPEAKRSMNRATASGSRGGPCCVSSGTLTSAGDS